ncbi:hypothetical protein D3C86_2135860 [compost metagenome]
MAIAIPLNDIIFEVIPKYLIAIKLNKIEIGILIITTSELLKWNKKMIMTIHTSMISSIMVFLRLLMAASIKSLRS